MNFEWKIERGKEPSFDDKIQNLACFEVVLNILRMKMRAGKDDVSDEIQALCGFALECMFRDVDLSDEDMFDTIMQLKDKKVDRFKSKLFKDMGLPEDMVNAREIGEA